MLSTGYGQQYPTDANTLKGRLAVLKTAKKIGTDVLLDKTSEDITLRVATSLPGTPMAVETQALNSSSRASGHFELDAVHPGE